MNRRDLFKRAGKLGAGLGLAAVVGKVAIPKDEPSVRSGFSQVLPVTESRGASSPAWLLTQAEPAGYTLVIDEHKYAPFEIDEFEAVPITENPGLSHAQADEDLIRLWRSTMDEYQRRQAL